MEADVGNAPRSSAAASHPAKVKRTAELCRSQHVKFFKRCLQVLPGAYASLDTSRVTVAFFAVSGLDLLGASEDELLSADERRSIVDWIYRLQVQSPAASADEAAAVPLPPPRQQPSGDGGSSWPAPRHRGGFAGWPSCCASEASHVAMTYTALATLAILGDDMRRVDRAAVAEGVRRLQMPDGGFRSTEDGGEDDMRFVYCAAWVCHVLGDWSGMDVERATAFIESSLTYEGGFAQRPFAEAHGGSTFCAVASLFLMGSLDRVLPVGGRRRERLLRWCCMRQTSAPNDGDAGGFQGRPNKQADTCYSFWIGASLCILDAYGRTLDRAANRSFLMTTQDPVVGGFAKWPGISPDALHAYMGLAGLALMAEPGVAALDPALNMSVRAAARLRAAFRAPSAAAT